MAAVSETEVRGLLGPVGGKILTEQAVGRPFGCDGAVKYRALDLRGEEGEGETAVLIFTQK
jgi:hypothetical protein